MEGSNQMIQIKKETDGSEQENNEILIKVEPEYVFSRYYNEDGGRTYNRRFKEDEDSATGEIDDRDNKSNIDDVSIKTEDNDSSSNTDDNVNNEVNDQAECSGKFEEQIVAWDNKKEEYVYINPASASKLFISKPRKPSKSKLAGKDKFYCNVKGCTFSTSRKSHMLRHEAVHAREAKRSKEPDDQKRYQCTECSYSTDNSCDIKRHGLVHSKSGRDKYTCKHCGYESYLKYHLVAHVSKMHTSNYSTFTCDYCQKSFKSKQSLDDHFIKCHPSLNYPYTSKILTCTNCIFKTALKRSLVRHMLLKHPVENAPMYECETCGHKTTLESNHVMHMRKHAEVKPFVCVGCGKGFLLKRSLDEHILRVHAEEEEAMKTMTYRILLCEQCDFRTVKSDVLSKHTVNSHQADDQT